ncbi:MAG: bifunctional folylpolyglutamate synthase/dihydrofolate synthase [Prevotella sp.]|nr:bifunctional folylpolyglutamate synthase/dihydrofolate synthase [Prevotella sp.]
MNYDQTIEYLYSSTPVFERVGASAYKEGLSNTIALDDHLGNPHRRYKTIHVAGTNGKGSTSHTLAAILQKAGYKVGLYTSPHLVDFRERIRVNGVAVSEEYVVDFVKDNREFFEPLHPSFFELTTAMAFKYFAEQKVDIAVIEVGLGGRLDCTNIISPVLSVITNISFDHTGFLGDTLEKIAGEKAGIIKPNTPVVIGEYTNETKPVFIGKAEEMNAPIIFAQDKAGEYQIPEFELRGACQERNAQTILTACDELIKIGLLGDNDSEVIVSGFAHVCEMTGLHGRWEEIQDNPLVICDTGHNLAGWEYLAPQIRSVYESKKADNPHARLRIIFGMVDDKDISSVISILPAEADYYFCQATTHRAIPVEKVVTLASEHGLHGKGYDSVEKAYRKAMEDAGEGDFVFVGGSSYVVADFLTFLG